MTIKKLPGNNFKKGAELEKGKLKGIAENMKDNRIEGVKYFFKSSNKI